MTKGKGVWDADQARKRSKFAFYGNFTCLILQLTLRLGVCINMKRIKWLFIGFAVAAVIGVILFRFWNLIVSVVAAVVLFVLFVVAIFAKGGFCWDHDEDEDHDDEDDEDDDDTD